MADKATRSAEELAQAYKKAIASGFAVADAGIAQTTAAVKMFTDAAQTERDEYGKAVEQAVTHSPRSRREPSGCDAEHDRYAQVRRNAFRPRGQGVRQQARRGRNGFLPSLDQGLDRLSLRR